MTVSSPTQLAVPKEQIVTTALIEFGGYVVEGGVAYELHHSWPPGPTDEVLVVVGPNGATEWQVWQTPDGWPHGYLSLDGFRRRLENTTANYALLQSAWVAHFNVWIGSRVRVIGVPKDGELGWGSYAMPAMSFLLDKVVQVESIHPNYGICTVGGPYFPFHVLAVVTDEDDRETVGKCEGCGKEIKEGETRNTWADDIVTCEKCSPPLHKPSQPAAEGEERITPDALVEDGWQWNNRDQVARFDLDEHIVEVHFEESPATGPVLCIDGDECRMPFQFMSDANWLLCRLSGEKPSPTPEPAGGEYRNLIYPADWPFPPGSEFSVNGGLTWHAIGAFCAPLGTHPIYRCRISTAQQAKRKAAFAEAHMESLVRLAQSMGWTEDGATLGSFLEWHMEQDCKRKTDLGCQIIDKDDEIRSLREDLTTLRAAAEAVATEWSAYVSQPGLPQMPVGLFAALTRLSALSPKTDVKGGGA